MAKEITGTKNVTVAISEKGQRNCESIRKVTPFNPKPANIYSTYLEEILQSKADELTSETETETKKK